MKAVLLILVAAAALALAGPAWAEGMSPDDRAYARATVPALGPDDRALSRAPELEANRRLEPTIVRISQRSFDWTDAGVGAASGFGIALVLIGGMLVVRRRGVATA